MDTTTITFDLNGFMAIWFVVFFAVVGGLVHSANVGVTEANKESLCTRCQQKINQPSKLGGPPILPPLND